MTVGPMTEDVIKAGGGFSPFLYRRHWVEETQFHGGLFLNGFLLHCPNEKLRLTLVGVWAMDCRYTRLQASANTTT